MNAQQKNNIRILAVLLPELFLIIMLVTPLLSQDKFYYKGHFDPKWFFRNYCGRRIVTLTDTSDTGNANFYNADMYYPELEDAGFTHTVTYGNMLNAGWYGNIKLFPYTLEIGAYGHAAHRKYEVGNDFEHDYFTDPLIGWAGEDPDYGFDEIIFYCNRDSCNAGDVINDTLWAGDQRRPLNWRVALKVKFRNAGSDQDTLLRITIGNDTSRMSDEWCQIMYSPTMEEPDPPPSTDSPDDYYLLVSQISQEGVYDTVVIATEKFGGYHNETIFKLYWYDQADLYLDWIHIYEKKDISIALVNSNTLDFSK